MTFMPLHVAGPGPALFEKSDSSTTWLSFTVARKGWGAPVVMWEGVAEKNATGTEMERVSPGLSGGSTPAPVPQASRTPGCMSFTTTAGTEPDQLAVPLFFTPTWNVKTVWPGAHFPREARPKLVMTRSGFPRAAAVGAGVRLVSCAGMPAALVIRHSASDALKIETKDVDMRLLLRVLINAAALWVAASIVPGIHAGGLGSVLALAVVFGVVNACVRPLLKLVSCPIILLTLGLFTLVLNALMLMLAAWLGRQLGIDFTVDGFWAAFLGALLVSIVSTLLSILAAEV